MWKPFKVVREGPKGADSHKHTFAILAMEPGKDTGTPINGASSSDGRECRKAMDKFCAALNAVWDDYMAGRFHEPATECADIFIVTRDCCTSGNCATCMSVDGHKAGDAVRVVQFITKLREMADRVQKNWISYKSEVHNVSERELQMLHPSSAAWVREKLLAPDRINDTMFECKK